MLREDLPALVLDEDEETKSSFHGRSIYLYRRSLSLRNDVENVSYNMAFALTLISVAIFSGIMTAAIKLSNITNPSTLSTLGFVFGDLIPGLIRLKYLMIHICHVI